MSLKELSEFYISLFNLDMQFLLDSLYSVLDSHL